MISLKSWRQDAQASLVVFLVALPLCLGIALASNAPLASGLIAGIIGGVVVGVFSGSNISVSGPAAGLTVIVATAITTLGSFEAFCVAVFLSGVFQIVFSLLKGGVIGHYFPTSVIKGMLAAIGLILILKQIPHAVGYDVDWMGDNAFGRADGNTFTDLLMAWKALHLGALIVSSLALTIMILWEKATGKFFKLVPGALVIVALSVVLNEVFKNFIPALAIEQSHLVQLPFNGGFSDFFAGLKLPNWSYLMDYRVYSVAITIALVGSIESLLSIEAADKIDAESRVTPKNQELLAQGFGNAISGLLGGLPLTAVIVRTTANVTAGGKSKLSAILHGLWLFLSVIFIPQVMNLIPLSALAAVLLLVGYKLTKPELFQKMWEKGMNQFIPFISTIVAILFTDLLVGICIGMVVGFIFVIRAHIHKAIVIVRDENQFLIRFHKDVSFLQKKTLLSYFNSIPAGSAVVIDGDGVFVDPDIEEIIEDYLKRAPAMNIDVTIKRSSMGLSPIFREA